MGQPIEVAARTVGDVALLSGNRSLSGQDGEAFGSPAAAAAGSSLPARLAAALFDLEGGIDHVYVLSNEVVVRRPGGWEDGILERATEVLAGFFVFYDGTDEGPVGGVGRGLAVVPATAPVVAEERSAELRARHYNATITSITPAHDKLWIMGVLPDGGVPDYGAGQYATLGLGYWEPRLDDLVEELQPGQEERLARRSYSISSPILGDDGELVAPDRDEALEFYVVLVESDWQGTPAVLTPRLFLKEAGDRICMGRKIAGRYRLDKLADADADVFLMSTGTGEAPHNRMALELLRRGHRGLIVAACAARYRRDLAYLEVHRELERRYPNYHYFALTTREPENEGGKLYLQDFVAGGMMEEELGIDLDPSGSHFFLCGNPGMIGLPEWDGDTPTFPESRGMAQVLAERGYTIDRRGVTGNVHYEEYW